MQFNVPKYGITITVILVMLASLPFAKTHAQPTEETGDLFIKISDIISNMPGHTGDDYFDPDASDISTWNTTLDHLFNGDYVLADASAAGIGYDLVEFTDNSGAIDRTYYVLETVGTNYWGTYVYNPNYCRAVVIQTTHALKDLNTGKQGIHVFIESEALFFCLNGTSRCNSSSYSSCDGTTSVCSAGYENYRISDLAHSTTAIYQATTEILLNEFSNSYFLQLHGFTKLSTDPYVILSNGTQVTPDPDYIVPLSNNLYAEDNVLTFKIAHVDLDWTRLRGFTNTQGRLINSSIDACNADATNTEGRFINIEQERTRLRDNEAGWDKLANAVKNTFICYSNFWEGSVSSDWNAASNWRSNVIPSASDNISITNAGYELLIYESVNNPAQCTHLEIQEGASVVVNAGYALTVHGNLNNSGTLTVKSDANLNGTMIVMGDVRGKVNIERYIGGWDDALHGWHFIASPVLGQEIADFHTAGSGNDFYKWDEPGNIWVNRTTSIGDVNPNFESEFITGSGYLMANNNNSTKTFSGKLVNTDIDTAGLTKTDASEYSGWHLLGNPFSSALIWNKTNWALTNIDATAKIWVESSASYLDIPSGTGIIPGMQGFMVHVNTAPGSLTIDADDRSHHGLNWYKNTEMNQLKLTAYDVERNTSQECIISVNENATAGFDTDYDAYFLAGYAPRFYSLMDGAKLSTNTLPEFLPETKIPLGFIKNESTEFYIEAEGVDNLNEKTVYLTDLKTGHTQILNQEPAYSFKAEDGEESSRFILHFSPLDATTNQALQIKVFREGSSIGVRSLQPITAEVYFYNVSGQLIAKTAIINRNSSTIDMGDFKGIVVVCVQTQSAVFTDKVFVW